MSSDDEEKYDDDDVTAADLEELVREPAPPVSEFFVGDRSLDYYLGFLRALQVGRQHASLKPNLADKRRKELIAVTAQAALDQHKRALSIDWDAANVPAEVLRSVASAWKEVRRCIAADCPAAAMAMCGKLLEIVLWRLWREEARPEEFTKDRNEKLGLDALHNRVTRLRIPEHKVVVETIIKYRNASVHGQRDYTVELDDAADVAVKLRRIIMEAWRPRQARTRSRNTTQRTVT